VLVVPGEGAIVSALEAYAVESMEHRAERAEEDADAAIVLAAYAVDAAEWAVIDAALARAEADEFVDH
jgi:hypothetical protein